MKKLLAACLCLGMTLTWSGCSLGNLVDRFINLHSSDEKTSTEIKTRVYMDELKGTLVDFTGNSISLLTNDIAYSFDVSEATLECKDGMITGDEISIIYEGQFSASDQDSSQIKVLKVVDDYHAHPDLQENTASGTVQNLTSNTITILDSQGTTATYPITGCEEFYQNGIQKDAVVYIHYYGQFGASSLSSPYVLNAGHLKVISISDTEPFSIPDFNNADTPANQKNPTLHATIQRLSLNTLDVLLDDHQTVLSFDLSDVPCYFKGGAAPGSGITIEYYGNFNGTTTEGMSLIRVIGEDPAKLKTPNINFTASGIIIAHTANTVSIQTGDGAVLTCHTNNTQNLTTGGMEIGDSIKITFNPVDNQTSNILTCIKIEDN